MIKIGTGSRNEPSMAAAICISFLMRIFTVDRDICTKFGTYVENVFSEWSKSTSSPRWRTAPILEICIFWHFFGLLVAINCLFRTITKLQPATAASCYGECR